MNARNPDLSCPPIFMAGGRGECQQKIEGALALTGGRNVVRQSLDSRSVGDQEA